jgi:hypothetical protein
MFASVKYKLLDFSKEVDPEVIAEWLKYEYVAMYCH